MKIIAAAIGAAFGMSVVNASDFHWKLIDEMKRDIPLGSSVRWAKHYVESRGFTCGPATDPDFSEGIQGLEYIHCIRLIGAGAERIRQEVAIVPNGHIVANYGTKYEPMPVEASK